MPFDHIHGQRAAIETLTRALRSGHLHHAYRFEGPNGVGKELAAIALAQALLCTASGAGAALGCGECSACRRAAQKSEEPPVPLHPDVVLLGRALYPPETIGGKKEANEISVEQVRRLVLSRAAYAPHEGRAQIFIIRDAEQLSISAANALLKTLEEPRPATHFVLLTAQSERLLDTIRSRSLPVRFAPLSDAVLGEILRAQGVAAERIAELVELAGGSAAAALRASAEDERGADFVRAVVAAVDARDIGPAVALAESVANERAVMLEDLRALSGAYARRVRGLVRSDARAAEVAARQHEICLDAIDAVERNGSTSLAVVSLVASLRHAYLRRPGEKPPIAMQRR
jgi:DNA polymerase III subunit delta'